MVSFLLMMAMQVAPAAPMVSANACPVWARELAFADSVRRHDLAAFGGFVDPDAVFGVTEKTQLRGRSVVIEQWKGIVAGEAIHLDWYPDRVMASNSGDLAWSTGPVLLELPDGKGGWAPRVGRFASVWRKNADGEWRVAFDGGANPVPATPEQVAAYKANRARPCDAD